MNFIVVLLIRGKFRFNVGIFRYIILIEIGGFPRIPEIFSDKLCIKVPDYMQIL